MDPSIARAQGATNALHTLLLFSWLGVGLLLAAPAASTLLQLALSRRREFEADLGAYELTGDARGLASALEKMERYQRRFLDLVRVFMVFANSTPWTNLNTNLPCKLLPGCTGNRFRCVRFHDIDRSWADCNFKFYSSLFCE
jgi:Zn-dependent protease with chaperone function